MEVDRTYSWLQTVHGAWRYQRSSPLQETEQFSFPTLIIYGWLTPCLEGWRWQGRKNGQATADIRLELNLEEAKVFVETQIKLEA